jgi:hypothetical protein
MKTHLKKPCEVIFLFIFTFVNSNDIHASVTSENPIKIQSVKNAFEAYFPDENIYLHGYNVASNIAEQPSSPMLVY